MTGRWHPLGTRDHRGRPNPGQLVAREHGVWRVNRIVPIRAADWTDDDRRRWDRADGTNEEEWRDHPYKVVLTHVGGAKPRTFAEPHTEGQVKVPASRARSYLWPTYRDGRWPQCSCCGEPMPCRAEMEERAITASLERVAELEAIHPEACWACKEPIRRRQDYVAYLGDNMLLPGREPPRFHTRRRCWGSAVRYEQDWITADPRRERILTWPDCPGTLVVHGDGSSECAGGNGLPDCAGHATHNHRVMQACYFGDPPCPRGCSLIGHPGTRATGRPPRRDRDRVQPTLDVAARAGRGEQ